MSKNFTLRFDEEQLNRLREIAKNKGLTLSALIRMKMLEELEVNNE